MAERKERKGSYAAPALDKAFLVIELLADHPQGLLASEMASALGRSLGELFRIVVVMEAAGYLQKSPVTDRYTITYKFLDIAYRATPTRQLTAAAVPEMQALARATEQSCHLVVAKHAEGLVIAREENPGVRGFALRLGASIDLLRSCSGQVILAFSAPAAAERLLDRIEAARGVAIDRAKLAARLADVRGRGGDMRESPVARGVTDISYPVFGFGGEVLAALTIPFLELIDGSQAVGVDAAREMLASATQRVSRLLGNVAED
ncbi:IclR family transcriptional regulator [Sphingomonas sp.]|uniref:IclR family transcriptional regulator n=1 Tax=Sphingomonas sp. TaxID=28214 RepID=UPI0035AF9216